MSSIIKVDQIQLSDGSTPTAGDLGITVPAGAMTDIDSWRFIDGYYNSINTAPADGWNHIATHKGSAMSLSSGVWTFPSTGIWRISASILFYNGSSTSYQFENASMNLQKTSDNGANWANFAAGETHVDFPADDWFRVQDRVEGLLNITDTANQKLRIRLYLYGAPNLYVGSGENQGGNLHFMRLGDS